MTLTAEEPFRFAYGPVEAFVVEFEGDQPDQGVLEAIAELAASDTIRVLDLVIAVRRADGSVLITELRESASGVLSELELELEGFVGEDDIADSLAAASAGHGVAIAAFEMRWATTLASRVASAGGRVVRAERISAPHVNDLVALAMAAATEEDD